LKAFFALILVFITNFSCFSASEFILNQTDSEVDLNGKISFFVDESQKLDISKIISKTEFQKSAHDKISFGYTRANAWVKTSFTYAGNEPKEYYFAYLVPLTYVVEQYLLDSQNNIIKENKSGCSVAFHTREEGNRYYLLRFIAQPNQSYTFYSKIHNDLGSLNSHYLLKDVASFHQFEQTETMWLFAFLILVSLAFVASLALFYFFNDKIYLFYAGYLFSILIIRLCIFGFAYKYIHPDIPVLAILSKILFWLTLATCFINFVPRLLSGTNQYFKRTVKLFQYQTVFYLGIFVYGIVMHATIGYMPNNAFNFYLVMLIQINYLISTALLLYITYKSVKNKFTPSIYFSISFLPLLLLMTLTTAANFKLIPPNFFTNYPIELGFTIEIVMLSFALMKRYKIIISEKQSLTYKLKEIEQLMTQKTEETIPKEKYQSSRFDSDELLKTHTQLINFMKDHKPYLKEDISIQTLAEMIGVNSHLLSQVINQFEHKNFFDFINSFRVEEAKKLLSSDKYEHYSAEGIGYECGFNTKATFYSTFKKYTGATPAEFRKNSYSADIQ
jgi:AraC-like DNA-binding protein